MTVDIKKGYTYTSKHKIIQYPLYRSNSAITVLLQVVSESLETMEPHRNYSLGPYVEYFAISKSLVRPFTSTVVCATLYVRIFSETCVSECVSV